MPQTASDSEKADVLNRQELSRLDAYWRAANYLSVGQIYLLDNPLLRGITHLTYPCCTYYLEA